MTEQDPILINTEGVPTLEVNSHDVDLLVVEDDDLLIKMFPRHLRGLFKRVFAETKTDKGLRVIEEELSPYSMVLTDFVNDYGYSGGQMALLSDATRRAKNIPLIITSGSHFSLGASVSGYVDGKETMGQLMQEGIVHGLVPKPALMADLKAAILSCYKNKA